MKFDKQLAWALAIPVSTALGMTLVACGPSAPVKTPQQVWIEAHPTHTDLKGECIEFDGEVCDDDPFDLDDFFEARNPTPSHLRPGSPKPMLTANQPKPKPSPVKPKRTR